MKCWDNFMCMYIHACVRVCVHRHIRMQQVVTLDEEGNVGLWLLLRLTTSSETDHDLGLAVGEPNPGRHSWFYLHLQAHCATFRI
jgi:hypothetical protein